MRIKFQSKLRHNNFMGRWGGGWKWKLGICIGGSCIFIEALFFSIRIEL